MLKLAIQLGLLVFFLNFSSELLAKEVYRINAHILIHQNYQDIHPKIQEQVLDIIKEVNAKFKQQKIPVILNLKSTEVFDLKLSTDNTTVILSTISVSMFKQTEMDLYDYLHGIYFVSEKVFPPKDFVLVFVKRTATNHYWGMSSLPDDPPHVAVLYPPENEDCLKNDCFLYLTHLFAHEVCHFFSAENLYDETNKEYLMYNGPWELQGPVYFKIDKENHQLILQGLEKYFK